jgi:hypothetical protein
MAMLCIRERQYTRTRWNPYLPPHAAYLISNSCFRVRRQRNRFFRKNYLIQSDGVRALNRAYALRAIYRLREGLRAHSAPTWVTVYRGRRSISPVKFRFKISNPRARGHALFGRVLQASRKPSRLSRVLLCRYRPKPSACDRMCLLHDVDIDIRAASAVIVKFNSQQVYT